MAARASLRSWWLTYPVMTAGAVADCVAFALSRAGAGGAFPLYWAGQIALLAPCIVICLRRVATASSRLWALQLLAALQALIAWAYSPDRFRFPDELQHMRTAHDIALTGHLFVANPALPVSPGYPSLEIVTTAVSRTGGVSLFTAGVLTASVAHVLLVTAVFLWARALDIGPRRAAASALVYGFAPGFPYFDTLFTYTAIAAPFLLLALRAAARTLTRRDSALLVLPPLLLAVVSHHLTGYIACGCVAVLAATLVRTKRRGRGLPLMGVAIAGVGVAAIWTAAFAPYAFDYLLTPTRATLAALVSPHGSSDATVGGIPPPLWQRVVSVLGSVTMAGAAVTGALLLWRSRAPKWLRRFGWTAMVYPAVLVLRAVAADGAEISARLLLYGMVLTCVPAALLLIRIWGNGASRRRVTVSFTVAAVTAAGATLASTPPSWERLPGKFRVASDESGIDSRTAAAAAFAGRTFFAYANSACDHSLCSLLDGDTRATTSVVATRMFYADDILRHALIGRLALDYVLVDDRIARQRPATGIYFPGEGNAHYPRPFPAARLAAFGSDPLYSRVYDNGDVQVYDVTAVWHA